MPIQLYNTATRSKEIFEPIDPSNVRMYVCGPTVYDRAHIGNARPVVVFDLLFRLFRHEFGADCVTYVRNITDVDDKINARAAERGVPITQITEETTQWFAEDMAALGALEPTKQPKATQHIPQMIELIERLMKCGSAYAAEGHVLFSVSSFKDYGALSRRSVEDMIAGARVEVAPYKRDPMDFVLWKPSSGAEPGWESPWGFGRPGWHIECSAMAREHLGDNFDIHGGGVDLVFPHHENERAQSLCAHPDSGFANLWMHNGFLQLEGKKMSKSLGNFFTVHDLREQGAPGEAMRLLLLSTQYRQPIDWTAHGLEEAQKTLRKWRALTADAAPSEATPNLLDALRDDLNTPKAIAELHALAAAGDAPALKASAQLMGLLTEDLGGWDAEPEASGDVAGLIDQLLVDRAEARKAKDFATSDAIRDGLIAAGVEIKDTPQGAQWNLSPNFDASKLPEPKT